MQAPQILVVEDDPVIRSVLLELLDGFGPCVGARNGVEALGALLKRPFDLVVLDMELPELDGPGLAREMASRGLSTPILAISAGLGLAAKARRIGAAAWLVKPFSVERIEEVVEDLLAEGTARAASLT